MLVSGLCVRNEARKTPVLGGGGSGPSSDHRVTDPTKALVGASCLCSCIRTLLLSASPLGDQSRETRPWLPGRSAEVVEVVALEQAVYGPGIVLVDDPVGDELPEKCRRSGNPAVQRSGVQVIQHPCVHVIPQS